MNGATLSREIKRDAKGDIKRDAKRGRSVLRRYEERLLQMPVALALAVMWVTGTVLIGLCVATLYEGGFLLALLVG